MVTGRSPLTFPLTAPRNWVPLALAVALCAPALAQAPPPDPEVTRLQGVVKALRRENSTLRRSADRKQAALRKELEEAQRERDRLISDVEHQSFELQRRWAMMVLLVVVLAAVIVLCLVLSVALLRSRPRTPPPGPEALAGARERLARLKAQLGADEARLLELRRSGERAPDE